MSAAMVGNWNYPTSMRFGAGRITELPQATAELGMSAPLIVTDPGVAGLPFVGEIQANLAAQGQRPGLFSQIQANPKVENVSAGVSAYREGRHDGVIALGGGSGLDVGKAVALMAGQARPLLDFEDIGDNWTRVDESKMAPVVAVPTTSGTGSEVGRASVIVDTATHTKRIIFHPGMLPAIVLADPALTVGLPAGLTAATGMDALSHNLEAWCALGFHPMADGIAMEGMRLVQSSLVQATRHGNDIDARSAMMAASSMGATAFQKGLGAMHAMSHPIGAIFNTHHGLTNAVVMPYVIAFNGPRIPERMDALAHGLGLPTPGLEGVLTWILDLREQLGIPHSLAEIGVSGPQVDALPPLAMADPSGATNPVPLTMANLAHLFHCALKGDVVSAASGA